MAQQSATKLQQSPQLFDMLKKDHREAEKMMKQIEKAPHAEREQLFGQLNEALTLHMQMEEKEFYPRIKRIKEMEDMVEDALMEHREAKEYLAELAEFGEDEEEWLSTFQDMQDVIQHHVEDEEQEIFPDCKKHMSEQEIAEIGQRCQQFQQQGLAPSSRTRSPQADRQQTKKQPQSRSHGTV